MDRSEWMRLNAAAWDARENAMVWGKTKVGAAVLADDNRIYQGCNIEAKFQLGIHAEVAALSAMVTGNSRNPRAILIAAEREFFTPCGSCMDWIMQLGGPDCKVGFSFSRPWAELLGVQVFTADELMPHYPH